MCGDAPPPPSGEIPGNPPGGSTGGTGLCCACPAEGDLNTNGFSNYFSTSYSHSNLLTNKGKMKITRTEEGGTVAIVKSFSLAYTAGATEAANKATITSAITSAMATWQSSASNYRIQVEQPGCKTQKLTMTYASTIVASGADVAVSVDGTAAPTPPTPGLRSFVQGGTAMTFYTNGVGDIPWTMVHEIGHTFGLPDEYIYDLTSATPAPTVTFKGASLPDKTVTLSTSAIAAATGKFNFDADCVMGRNGNGKYPEYVFYWVAIEVQKIFTAAGVNAVVKVVAA
ncbi:MAG: hypothetical protein MUD11_08795 [Rhodobacteraceae bacterium]|nr:hypothetical protein [Paracoccaceae bacterium]